MIPGIALSDPSCVISHNSKSFCGIKALLVRFSGVEHVGFLCSDKYCVDLLGDLAEPG